MGTFITNTDPSTTGLNAPVGSEAQHSTNGQTWIKSGTGDLNWSPSENANWIPLQYMKPREGFDDVNVWIAIVGQFRKVMKAVGQQLCNHQNLQNHT